MRQIFILSLGAALATGSLANAQENNPTRKAGTINSKGISIIPEAKDFAIGVDATPFLSYFGNVFSNSGNPAPVFSGFNGSLYGKYFLTDKTAVRVKLNLHLNTTQESATVRDDQKFASNPLDINATTVDYLDTKMSTFDLRLGYEMRRGYGRLQGFYGGEVLIGRNRTKSEYTYGNEMTSLNQSPTSHWGTGTERTLSAKSAATLRIGAGGFAGVEYFFTPKIAIGGELGLAFYMNGNFNFGQSTSESFNAATNSVQTQTHRINQRANNATGVQTLTTGNIFLTFHF